MKKRIALLLIVTFAVFSISPCLSVFAATGSMSVSASTASVTIGQTVTLTITYDGNKNEIASISSNIVYDTKVLELTSSGGSDGTTVNGNAGVIQAIFEMPSSGVLPTSVSFSLTFKAISSGNNSFNITTDEFTSNSEGYPSLGTPGKTLSISAINPTKSGNANLASLKPSKGTLTPKFSANTTSYTITVPYTVTSLTLSATTAHEDAKTAISGKNALSVGKNTRVITVTAPNGTTKKYTVVITRSANQNTTTGTNNTAATTTTAPQPAEDALEVEVDGKLMLVPEVQPTVDLPDGYRWDSVPINGIDVPAAKNESSGVVLLYLTEKDAAASAFYVYDASADTFSAFRPLSVSGGVFVLHDLPDSETGPQGTVPGTLNYEGGSVSAYVYEDPAQADFSIVYATSPSGNTGLYVYDRTDGSLQRYREIELPTGNEPTDGPDKQTSGFVKFLTDHKSIILVGAAVCGGLALLIGAVILLISFLRRPRRFKH